jgi:hypothetical protein
MREVNSSKVAVAVGFSVLCLLISSCGSSSAGHESVATLKVPPAEQIDNHLTNQDRRRTLVTARRSTNVESVIGSHRSRLASLVPVTNADGTELEGAVVTISFKPAVSLDHRRLPTQILPNRLAPPGTPPLRRSYSCSATGVTKLEVHVDLDTGHVVEIVPAGPKARITEMQLIGATLPRFYKPISED